MPSGNVAGSATPPRPKTATFCRSVAVRGLYLAAAAVLCYRASRPDQDRAAVWTQVSAYPSDRRACRLDPAHLPGRSLWAFDHALCCTRRPLECMQTLCIQRNPGSHVPARFSTTLLCRLTNRAYVLLMSRSAKSLIVKAKYTVPRKVPLP